VHFLTFFTASVVSPAGFSLLGAHLTSLGIAAITQTQHSLVKLTTACLHILSKSGVA